MLTLARELCESSSKSMKSFKDIILYSLKDPPKGKGKAMVEEPELLINFRELSTSAIVLYIGEEFISYVHNLYKSIVEVFVVVELPVILRSHKTKLKRNP